MAFLKRNSVQSPPADSAAVNQEKKSLFSRKSISGTNVKNDENAPKTGSHLFSRSVQNPGCGVRL